MSFFCLLLKMNGIPVTVKSAMDEAEGALVSLREDFELIQKQAMMKDDAGNAIISSSSLSNALMSLDDEDAAKLRVAVSFALASLYYSLS